MRIIVRASTITECAKVVSNKVKEGWNPITKIKLDDSQISYGDVSYVCVLEKPNIELSEEKKKKNRFNNWMGR